MGELADWENLRNLSVKIIDGSPSLKKLKGNDFDAEFLGYVSEEKYALLDNFTLAVETDSEEKKCSTLALAEPALSSLWLLAPSESGSRYKRSFINVLEKLLSSSCQTMEALTMSSPTFPLNILSISPLVNLRSMTFLEDGTASHLLHNLRAVDYTKLLPALLEVKIAVGSEVGPYDIIMNHWEEQQEAQLVQVHPSATVKHLSVRAEFNLLTFEDLSPIFPNVVNLELDAQLMHPLSPNASAVWRDLWACWPHLESVSLDYQRGALRWNFDAEFLGVHSEEVEILRGMDKPSLEKLNLVPIRPSVLIFSRLRNLKFVLRTYRGEAGVHPDQLIFLSKWTGILALKKMVMAGVEIQFILKDPHAALRLNHLSSFVSFVRDYQVVDANVSSLIFVVSK